ncbi:MAG TPA: helix-turn-helix domain-containing protein [Dehalococcoidia bacterium]|nr:helix-turn-helix domain-containing protein [Dehalococcoidia bacterium]
MVREIDFTFDEAVRTLGVTPVRLERLIEEGKVPAVREGIRILIPRQAILDYLSQVSAVPIKERKGRGAQA